MREFGAFLPLSREGVRYVQRNREAVEAAVTAFVLVCDPSAHHIRVICHVWDDDKAANEQARLQFGLPLGTCGTVGWRCQTEDFGERVS